MANLFNDMYFSKTYISLYLNPGDTIFEFEKRKDNNLLYNISIKRQIYDTSYFDLETAYGFGGFLSNTDDIDFIYDSLLEYKNYCKENNIVAEFIRFHPLNDFANLLIENEKLKNIFNLLRLERKVVYVDLTLDIEEIIKGFSKGRKSDIKMAEKKNLVFTELSKVDYMPIFKKIYFQTMDRNNADKYYYFSENYFIKMVEIENFRLFSVSNQNEIVSMAIIIESFPNIYYHLGATTESGLKLKAMPYLLFKVIELYNKKGNYEKFILGGGRTNSDTDTLFLFKKEFSEKILPFYIAGIIYNQDIYNKLSKIESKKFLSWR